MDMGLFGISPKKVEKWAAEGNVEKLLGVLNYSDAAIRRLAVTELSKMRSKEVMDFCRKNANSDDEQLRWQITQILGLNGTPEAIKILEGVKQPKKKGLDAIAAYKYKANPDPEE